MRKTTIKKKESNLLKIGIDLDNTITASFESLSFFLLLTESLKDKAEIFIISDRKSSLSSYAKTEEELDVLGIYYDTLLLVSDKRREVMENEISIFFDDTDECFLEFPPTVTVFKIREDGNFNFQKKKWVGSEKTVEII